MDRLKIQFTVKRTMLAITLLSFACAAATRIGPPPDEIHIDEQWVVATFAAAGSGIGCLLGRFFIGAIIGFAIAVALLSRTVEL